VSDLEYGEHFVWLVLTYWLWLHCWLKVTVKVLSVSYAVDNRHLLQLVLRNWEIAAFSYGQLVGSSGGLTCYEHVKGCMYAVHLTAQETCWIDDQFRTLMVLTWHNIYIHRRYNMAQGYIFTRDDAIISTILTAVLFILGMLLPPSYGMCTNWVLNLHYSGSGPKVLIVFRIIDSVIPCCRRIWGDTSRICQGITKSHKHVFINMYNLGSCHIPYSIWLVIWKS
jgi:hypothetical protein